MTPRTISMSSVRPEAPDARAPCGRRGRRLVRTTHVVAGAEAQQRRGPVAQVGEDELAGGAVRRARPTRPCPGRSAPRGRSRVRRGACRPAPRTRPTARRRCRRSPSPRSPARPSPASSAARKAGSPPPGSPATSTRSTLDPAQVEAARPPPTRRRSAAYDGRQHGGLGAKQVDRRDEPLGVAGADRDVAEADPVERGERGAGDERPGVVGRDDPLAGADAGGRVAAGGARDPVLEVAAPSAGCSSACRSCRSSSRCGRLLGRRAQRCEPIGLLGVHVARSSCLLGEREPARSRPARRRRARVTRCRPRPSFSR